MSEPSGFEIASAFVQVSPNLDTFEEQVVGELEGMDLVVQVPVVANADGLPESVQAAADASEAAITVPVTVDAAGLPEQVDAAVAGMADQVTSTAGTVGTEAGTAFSERFAAAVSSADLFPAQEGADAESGAAGGTAGGVFGEQFTAAALERMTSLFTGDSEVMAEAAAAGEEAGMAFGNAFAAAAGTRMSNLFAGDADVLAESGAAGEEAGMAFSRGFTTATAGMQAPLAAMAPAAAAEAETAGDTAAVGFGTRFKSMLAGIPLLGGMIPGVEREAADGGALAGSSFMGNMKGIIAGDLPVMETLLGAGFVAATAVMATKFQAAMELIHTQAGVGQSAIAGLSNSVLNLAGTVGESPDSLAQALYHVESAFQSSGITGAKAMQILQVAAEGARTGNANLVDVQNALDATIASGVGGVTNYSQAMGALNAIVGTGDMTMQDLADAMGTGLMAAGKAYGQTIQQIGAALATFGDNNIRGAKAATDLRMTWQAIEAPLKTGDAALQSLGLTSSQLSHTLTDQGLTAALQLFVQHLEASKVPVSDWGQYITEIFGKRAGVGINVLIDQLSRLQGKLPDITKAAGNFGDSWAATSQTAKQHLAELESGFEALLIRIGDGLLPAVNAFMAMVVRNLPAIERLGTQIAHLAAPFVTAFFTGLEAILKVLFGPLRKVTEAVIAFGAAWLALDVIMAMNPFVAIGIALVVLVGLIVKYHKQIWAVIVKVWGDIEHFFEGLYDKITPPVIRAFDAVKKYIGHIWGGTWNDLIAPVIRFFSDVKNAITSGFDSWWASHGKEVEQVWHAVWTVMLRRLQGDLRGRSSTRSRSRAVEADLSDFLTVSWDVLKAAWRVVWDDVSMVAKIAWDAIATVFKVAWDAISATFKATWDVLAAVVKVAVDAIMATVKATWDLIVGIFNVFLDLVTGHWSKAWSDVQTTATQVWNQIKTFLTQTWNALITLITQVVNNIAAFLTQAWNAIKGGVSTAWNDVRSTIASIWNGILSDITGVVNKIKSVVSDVMGMPGKILSGAGNFLGSAASALGFAGGGVVPGFAPGKDSVHAVLSPGEAVLVPEAVKAIGAHRIHAINAHYSRGRGGTSFAYGGIAGYAGGGVVGGGMPDGMASYALASLAAMFERVLAAVGAPVNGISPAFGGASGVPQPVRRLRVLRGRPVRAGTRGERRRQRQLLRHAGTRLRADARDHDRALRRGGGELVGPVAPVPGRAGPAVPAAIFLP